MNGIDFVFEEKDIKIALIISDGIEQVSGISLNDFIIKLLSFKALEGKFLTRKMIRLNKESQKENYSWNDDISVSGFIWE